MRTLLVVLMLAIMPGALRGAEVLTLVPSDAAAVVWVRDVGKLRERLKRTAPITYLRTAEEADPFRQAWSAYLKGFGDSFPLDRADVVQIGRALKDGAAIYNEAATQDAGAVALGNTVILAKLRRDRWEALAPLLDSIWRANRRRFATSFTRSVHGESVRRFVLREPQESPIGAGFSAVDVGHFSGWLVVVLDGGDGTSIESVAARIHDPEKASGMLHEPRFREFMNSYGDASKAFAGAYLRVSDIMNAWEPEGTVDEEVLGLLKSVGALGAMVHEIDGSLVPDALIQFDEGVGPLASFLSPIKPVTLERMRRVPREATFTVLLGMDVGATFQLAQRWMSVELPEEWETFAHTIDAIETDFDFDVVDRLIVPLRGEHLFFATTPMINPPHISEDEWTPDVRGFHLSLGAADGKAWLGSVADGWEVVAETTDEWMAPQRAKVGAVDILIPVYNEAPEDEDINPVLLGSADSVTLIFDPERIDETVANLTRADNGDSLLSRPSLARWVSTQKPGEVLGLLHQSQEDLERAQTTGRVEKIEEMKLRIQRYPRDADFLKVLMNTLEALPAGPNLAASFGDTILTLRKSGSVYCVRGEFIERDE